MLPAETVVARGGGEGSCVVALGIQQILDALDQAVGNAVGAYVQSPFADGVSKLFNTCGINILTDIGGSLAQMGRGRRAIILRVSRVCPLGFARLVERLCLARTRQGVVIVDFHGGDLVIDMLTRISAVEGITLAM